MAKLNKKKVSKGLELKNPMGLDSSTDYSLRKTIELKSIKKKSKGVV